MTIARRTLRSRRPPPAPEVVGLLESGQQLALGALQARRQEVVAADDASRDKAPEAARNRPLHAAVVVAAVDVREFDRLAPTAEKLGAAVSDSRYVVFGQQLHVRLELRVDVEH